MLKSLRHVYSSRCLMNNVYYFSSKTEAPDLGLKKKKRVGDDNIRVTLLSASEDISIVSLAEAQKLSKRRDLKLVKVIDLDTKTKRPVYKMMSASEFHEEEIKKRAEKKEARKQAHLKPEKLLQVTGTMAKHDADIKIRKLNNWLVKYHEVRVILIAEGKPFSYVEEIFNQIQEAVKEIGIINQKHVIKQNAIKFQIKPNVENIEKLKQDPEFQKKHQHHLQEQDDDQEDGDDDNDDDSPVIEINVTSAKQSSFINKS